MWDCDRTTENDDDVLVYFCASVFLMITCWTPLLGCMVADRWIESALEKLVDGTNSCPTDLMSSKFMLNKSWLSPQLANSVVSVPIRSRSLSFQVFSSFSEQALSRISYSRPSA